MQWVGIENSFILPLHMSMLCLVQVSLLAWICLLTHHWKAVLRFTSICLSMFATPVPKEQSQQTWKIHKTYIFLNMTITTPKAFYSRKTTAEIAATKLFSIILLQFIELLLQWSAVSTYKQGARVNSAMFWPFFVLFVYLFKQRNIWLQILRNNS